MSCGADKEANQLIVELTKDAEFPIPKVDLDSSMFKLPNGLNSEIYKTVTRLTNDDLTTREVDGKGTFDALMGGFNAHLRQEYEKGRITGAEYTKAYIELTQSAMSGAVSYLLGRDQSFWQALTAQTAIITAAVELEKAKVQLVALQLEAQNQEAAYALAKMRLSTESMQYCISKFQLEYTLPAQHQMILTQRDGQLIENDLNLARLNDLMPIEIETAQKKMELMDIELSTAGYNLEFTLPKQLEILEGQKANLEADAALKQFQRTDMLPQQKNILIAEAAMKEVERATAQSRLDNVLPLEISSIGYDNQIKGYTANNILPLDALIKRFTHEGLQAKNEIDQFTLTTMLPKQAAIAEVQRQTAQYTFDNILPKQAMMISEQTEAARAQTFDVRTDNLPVAGVLGAQKALSAQQVQSYKSDAMIKGAKIFSDAWSVQKTMDEGLAPPTAFINSSVDVVMANLRSTLDLD